MDAATKSVQKEQAANRIAFGLKHDHGPKRVEASEELRKLPAGSPVYIYRDKTKKWEGPFPFVQIDGEMVVIQLPTGRKIFRSTVVKPLVRSILRECSTAQNNFEEQSVPNISNNEERKDSPSIGEHQCAVMFGSTKVVIAPFSEGDEFSDTREKELDGLMKNGTFEVVKLSSVPKGQQIYGTRFVDAYKTIDGKDIKKSRLVAQNYSDLQASSISTKAPTVSRLGQRLTVCLAACFAEYQSHFRDISQAYVQSNSSLERKIFLRPPPEMGIADDEVLLARKPLYGIPESGLHWFLTYQSHHREALNMKATKVDACVLYRRDGANIDGLTTLQVDDSFGHGSHTFLSEEHERCQFKSKPRKLLRENDGGVFNGVYIFKAADGTYSMTQTEKLKSLKAVTNAEEFKSVRTAAQYIDNCVRPDICAAVQLIASGAEGPSENQIKALNNVVKHCNSTSDIGLRYVSLDVSSACLVLLTDASFANTADLKSQLGFVLLMVDKYGNANIVHYGSSRCKRVARSVMAAEIHALVYGFDNAYIAKNMLSEKLGRTVEVHGYIDSRTLFNVVAKSAVTLEKRLQIDVAALRESHERGEHSSFSWIPSDENIADALTKACNWVLHALWRLMYSNRFEVSAKGWVKRFEAASSKAEK